MIIKSKRQISKAKKIRSVNLSENSWNFKEKWIIFLYHQGRNLKNKLKEDLISSKNWIANRIKTLQDFWSMPKKNREYKLNFQLTILLLETNKRKKIANRISKFSKQSKNGRQIKDCQIQEKNKRKNNYKCKCK
jgi:transcriptional antiterminator